MKIAVKMTFSNSAKTEWRDTQEGRGKKSDTPARAAQPETGEEMFRGAEQPSPGKGVESDEK